jgi:hypothetical protein
MAAVAVHVAAPALDLDAGGGRGGQGGGDQAEGKGMAGKSAEGQGDSGEWKELMYLSVYQKPHASRLIHSGDFGNTVFRRT